MKTVKIGIDSIGYIHLRASDNWLTINDCTNDGVIECKIKNIKKLIRIIKDVYNNHRKLEDIPYGHDRNTIHLGRYQSKLGLTVFASNYIIISHMPDIIKMLKSVKIEKEKYILEKDNLIGLSINNLEELKNIIKRRKRIFVDDSGSKYIEV